MSYYKFQKLFKKRLKAKQIIHSSVYHFIVEYLFVCLNKSEIILQQFIRWNILKYFVQFFFVDPHVIKDVSTLFNRKSDFVLKPIGNIVFTHRSS